MEMYEQALMHSPDSVKILNVMCRLDLMEVCCLTSATAYQHGIVVVVMCVPRKLILMLCK